MKKIYYSQEQIEAMTRQLIDMIKDEHHKFDAVVGIRHGGIHVSKPIAKALNLPHEEIHISFRENGDIIDMNGVVPTKRKLLIVDDIVDDGTTMNTAVDKLYGMGSGSLYAAALFMSHNRYIKVAIDFFSAYKPDGWVVFPWEASPEAEIKIGTTTFPPCLDNTIYTDEEIKANEYRNKWGGCLSKKWCENCKKWIKGSLCVCALWKCPDCDNPLTLTNPGLKFNESIS